MNFIKSAYLFFFAIIMVSACGSIQGTQISGNLKGAENMTIYLEETAITQQGNTLVNSAIGSDGSFKLSIPDGIKKGLYRLRIGEQNVDLVIDGKEKDIKVTGNLSELNEFTHVVTGSPLTQEYMRIVQDYINKKIDVPALTEEVRTKADPLIASQIGIRLFTIRPEFLNLHESISAKLFASEPNLNIAKEYAMVVAQMNQQAQMEKAASKIRVGEPAPEIALPGPDGKMRKLSDLKGKVVLIDFWASWCGPCRKANPHVVEIYKKYKSKGFDVFSVSLDGMDSRTAQRFAGDQAQLTQQMEGSKQRWVSAIEQDELLWDNHVSDLKKWESAPAGEYGVRSIPQTFLVGKDGKIAAINPRFDLEEQVQKFL